MSGGNTIANAPSGEKTNILGTELIPISGSQYAKVSAMGRVRDTTDVGAATYDLLVTDNILLVSYTATGAVTSLTLPTAQCIDGRTITIEDAGGKCATNNITIDTEGAETINGEATYVMQDDYESATLVSDGSNWFVVSHHNRDARGSIYLYAGSQTITINTASAYHAVVGLLEGTYNNAFTYLASSTGSITDTASNGDTSPLLRCTDGTHGLTTGQIITLNGMGDAAHNGVTAVTVIDPDTFDCDDIAYSSAADTGSWQRGTSLTVKSGYGGHYGIDFSVSASASVASKNIKVEVYVNTTPQDEYVCERLFNNTGLGVATAGGIVHLASGDILWIALENTTDTTNVVIEHANIHAHK